MLTNECRKMKRVREQYAFAHRTLDYEVKFTFELFRSITPQELMDSKPIEPMA